MSAGPDIAGLYAALAKVNPQRRATYRAASSTHATAKAMRAGRRYRTRSLPAVRQPAVHEVAESGWVVRHTHDVDQARELLVAHCRAQEWWDDERVTVWDGVKGRQVWLRIVPCLPNSWGAAEGYAFTYNPAEPHSRGAFRAVEFYD